MASIIVGVSGKKRSGKDTFAERLVTEDGFTRIAFADPLKAVATRINPLIQIEADELGILYGPGVLGRLTNGKESARLTSILKAIGWERAKEIREVRRLLQNLGVSVREEVSLDVWVSAALRRASVIDGPVVIPDMRFRNEFDAVDYTVRVDRPGIDTSDAHISETELDETAHDYCLKNDDSVEDLHRKADVFVRSVLTGNLL